MSFFKGTPFIPNPHRYKDGERFVQRFYTPKTAIRSLTHSFGQLFICRKIIQHPHVYQYHFDMLHTPFVHQIRYDESLF